MSTPATTTATTLATTRPERTMPAEEGETWWVRVRGQRCVAETFGDNGDLCYSGDGVVASTVADCEADGVEFLAPIPTPEQLAAQAAKVAAGQALADAVRRWQAADELWRDLKHGDDLRAAGEASNLMFEAESALRTVDLAAFPAGGAR